MLDYKKDLLDRFVFSELPNSQIISIGVDEDKLNIKHQDFSKSKHPEPERINLKIPEDLSLYEHYIYRNHVLYKKEYEGLCEERIEQFKRRLEEDLFFKFNDRIKEHGSIFKIKQVTSNFMFNWLGLNNRYKCESRLYYKEVYE